MIHVLAPQLRGGGSIRMVGSLARDRPTPAPHASRALSRFGELEWSGGSPRDGCPFLRELNGCAATHLSLEAAQPGLDPDVLLDVPDKVIVLGVLDLGSSEPETPEVVAGRIERALEVLPPTRLVVAPDCGMKYLTRELAFRKLEAMVAGARLVDGAAA